MDTPSRAPAPPSLNLGPVRAVASPLEGSPQSADSVTPGPFSSDYPASPTSTTSPLLWGGRKASSGFGPASLESLKKPSPVVSQRKVNAHSYCGRHSDEFLFGGKGFGDLWRAVIKK
ncbi:hypothetical protein N657DRAFT_645107 [Parathielavia appendiculata]|uniref:Uncharacterized protein n=1 Tax=Parathielavia appendiculata TaxID=2587402 RepID=A0AAN6TZQ9_9PEZI|nr:hypothetical protein N657DRAFT_645107 [Parathielavia appendiculata]